MGLKGKGWSSFKRECYLESEVRVSISSGRFLMASSSDWRASLCIFNAWFSMVKAESRLDASNPKRLPPCMATCLFRDHRHPVRSTFQSVAP